MIEKKVAYEELNLLPIWLNKTRPKKIKHALFNIGYYYKMKNKVDSAAIAYQDAKNLCLGLGDSSSYNKIQISYAGLLVMQNKPFEALRVLVHVESYFKRTTNNNLLGDTYFFQASTYGKVGRYQEAIDTYKKLIPLYAKDNRFDRLAKCYGNLGHLYQRMDNNSRALDNYLKALEYFNEGLTINRAIEDNIGTILMPAFFAKPL